MMRDLVMSIGMADKSVCMENKYIVFFANEMSSNYDALFSLIGDLPFESKTMEDLIKKNNSTSD